MSEELSTVKETKETGFFGAYRAPCIWRMNTETWAWDEIQIKDLKKGDVYHYPTPHPDVRDVGIAMEDAYEDNGEPTVKCKELGYSFVIGEQLDRG